MVSTVAMQNFMPDLFPSSLQDMKIDLFICFYPGHWTVDALIRGWTTPVVDNKTHRLIDDKGSRFVWLVWSYYIVKYKCTYKYIFRMVNQLKQGTKFS